MTSAEKREMKTARTFMEDNAPDSICPSKVWKKYDTALGVNAQLNLDSIVETNENFFIGKQWEGVQANGLPTPVFNLLKRAVLFTVANVTNSNLKINASPMSLSGDNKAKQQIADIINSEFEVLFEMNDISSLIREYARNAAVDGDGCTYTYWDSEAETGQLVKGAIVTEIIDNTRVFFGNPTDRSVQAQPFIIISRRRPFKEVQKQAKSNDIDTWRHIQPDTDERTITYANISDDNTTILTYLWKNDETNTIWAYECTRLSSVREKWDTKLALYPITWLNWDYVPDCYHGMAMITGLIPNQIFINKAFAMSMISIMTTAYPKIVYDKTRIKKWDNRVGAAIPVTGGDVNSVARIIDPAQISPQISQFIQSAIEYTQSFLGATSVALGDTRPDNTSAIIALQRAASTPNEITKQNIRKSIEDLGRIYIDYMANYYGTRQAYLDIPEEAKEAAMYAGISTDTKVPMSFDFSTLKDMQFFIKLEAGESAYWSEIASAQTLDNLLMQGKIDLVDYLERIPNGYITKRQDLIDKMQKMQQALTSAAPLNINGISSSANNSLAASSSESSGNTEIPTGRGYSALQRKINKGAAV